MQKYYEEFEDLVKHKDTELPITVKEIEACKTAMSVIISDGTPARYYHDWDHASSVYAHARLINDNIPSWQAFIFAIYHDRVYTPGSQFNELFSLHTFLNALLHNEIWIKGSEAEFLAATILNTNLFTRAKPKNHASACLIDADLFGLVASFNTFAGNTRLIYKESRLSVREFTQKRIAFLDLILPMAKNEELVYTLDNSAALMNIQQELDILHDAVKSGDYSYLKV